MTPAERAIQAFGSKEALASAVGRHVSRIHRWLYSREEGGTGGMIPSSAQQIILQKAREQGLPLTAEDLIGSPVEDEDLPDRKRRAVR